MGTRKYYTAFGETKHLTAWAKDPRCRVSVSKLSERLTIGWTPELAITTPCPPKSNEASRIEAFGEVKTLCQWAKDPRSTVTVGGLSGRLKRNWSPEEAITTPSSRDRTLADRFRRETGFNSYREYAATLPDPVGVETFWERARKGWTWEQAATIPLYGGRN